MTNPTERERLDAADLQQIPTEGRVPGIGQRAAAGAVWLTIETVVVQMLALLVFAVLAHFLTPNSFGLVALAFAIIFSLRMVFLDNLLTPVTSKAIPTDLDYTTAFWMTAIIGVAGTAVLELVAYILDVVLKIELGRVLYSMSVIFLPLSLGKTQEAWLSRSSRFRVLAIRSIGAAIIGGLVGIGCALGKLGVWSLVIQQVVSSFLNLLFLWWTTPWRPRLRFDALMARKILLFQRDLGLGSVLTVLNQNADSALVAIVFGPSAVGIYSVAKRLRLALQMVAATPVRASTLPILSDLQDDLPKLSAAFLQAAQFVAMISAPIFIGAAAVSQDAIPAIFGNRWSNAAPIFAWLCIGAFCSTVVDYAAVMLQWRDRPGWLSMLTALQTFISLSLFYPISTYGIGTIAAPFVLPYIVILPVCLAAVGRLLHINLGQWLVPIAYPTAGAVAMGLVVAEISTHLGLTSHVMRLVVLSLVGIVVYGLLAGLLFRTALAKSIGMFQHRLARPGGSRRSR